MSRHLLPIERTDRSEWGRVDHALVEAATAAGHPDVEDAELEAIGVGSAWLTRANGSRVTPADVYVALGGSELDVRGETTVRRVLMTNGRATGVLTESGDVIDADEVTLATGAFETAAQLQRSLATDRTRCRVRDHPSIRFTLRLRDPNDPDDLAGLVAATLLRWSSPGGDGDIQVLPLNHLGSHADPHLAGLLVVLLDARSAGTLEVADDGTRASVSLGLLAADEDRRRMRAAARHVATLLGSEPFADIAEDVFVDDRGTRLADLALGDDDVLDRWMLSSVGDTYHAGSSSPMGGPADRARVVDEEGLVVGARSLRVCDASIFPDLPVANPYLPLVTVAEEIARRAIAAD